MPHRRNRQRTRVGLLKGPSAPNSIASVEDPKAMSRILTPQIGRRQVVRGLSAAAAVALVPGARLAQAAPKLVATPSQTEGPFYPTDWSGDVDNDLVVVTGEAAHAQGQITHILGRILDTSGAPIPDGQSKSGSAMPRASIGIRATRTFSASATAASRAAGVRAPQQTADTPFAPSGRSPIPDARRTSTSRSPRPAGPTSSHKCTSPANR